MDWRGWAKRWRSTLEKWANATVGPEWYPSLSERIVKVGFLAVWVLCDFWGVPHPSRINSRHFQATNTTNRERFQPIKPSQSHQGSVTNVSVKVKNSNFLMIFTRPMWSKRVNGQLLPWSLKLKSSDSIWMDVVEPKEEGPSLKNERTQLCALIGTHHYLRE